MKLYYSLGSCALASHIVLEEAGADYEAVRISLKDGDQHKPEFRAVNPKGRVPALVTDRGVITETPAILAYLAQTHPAAGLMPLDDPFAFAQAQAFNNYISSTVHVAYAHKFRGARWADDEAAIQEMIRKAPEAVASALQLIEDRMLEGPWVLGRTYSACDAYLYVMSGWIGRVDLPADRFPRLAEHNARVAERPAVSKVLAQEAA